MISKRILPFLHKQNCVCGTKIKPGELVRKMASLDIDEGIRVEYGGKKIFVNKGPSDIFAVQLGDSDDFHYFDSARQAEKFIESQLGKKAIAWIY